MIENFRQAMRSAGIETKDEILADGNFRRLTVDGDKAGSKNGFYILHGDGLPAGRFGCHKRGIDEKWSSKDYQTFSPEEKALFAARMKATQQQRDADLFRVQADCRKWCTDTFEKAKAATDDHPYLKKKGVHAHSVKQLRDSLLIPLRDVSAVIHGLQFIMPDGTKKFKTGTAKHGNYFSIGRPRENTLLICEGYATGASLHEATGNAVAVAFDAGNLQPVAENLRKKYPSYQLIICADNDASGVGAEKAKGAALAVGGEVALPPDIGDDFNDLHQKQGPAAVKACIDAVLDGKEKLVNRNTWEPSISEWPMMDSRAYHGLAGDFVRLAAAKSEADPAAILATFFVRFSVECGSAPTLYVGDTMHKARLAAVIVGASSKARKGTSGKPIDRLFSMIEGKARYSPGPFSSGEGIIHAVRDQTTKWDEKAQAEVVTDPGVEDKRLFILDEEFAGAMAQTKREGNTLSMVIRNAWDNGNLDPLTKTNKTTATNAHIGWISHITLAELHTRLNDTEMFNGFANRILWVCAKRSQIVPLPEPMDDVKLEAIRKALVEKINQYLRKDFVRITMGQEAQAAWCNHYYAELTRDHQGMVGSVINRGEAQVVRLAMIYALLDGMTVIGLVHLEAAIAFWRYCEQSARYIFHGRQSDGVAEKILTALTEGPMTGTDIFKLFANNIKKERLEIVLSALKASCQVSFEKSDTSKKGRPTMLWKINTLNEINEINEINHKVSTINSFSSFNSLGVFENSEVF